MLNRFRKMLSILCVAALLLSCLPASFADTAEILEETQVTETVDPVETSQEESISEEVATSAETSEEAPSEDKEEAPGANPAENEVSADTPVVPAADESGVTEESASQPEEPEAEPTQPEQPETTAPAEEETSVQNDENKPEFVSDPVQIEPEEEKEPEQVTEPEQEKEPEQEAEPEQPAQPADPMEPEKQPETAQPETEQPEGEQSETDQPEAEQPETAEPETKSEEDTDNPYTLRLGRGYLMCPLKANEKFEVAFHSKWNRTILATLTLSPKEGETLPIPDPDSEDKIIRVWIGEEEMDLTLVENEDPEFKGLTFQFLTYIENDKDYTFTLLASQDAEAGLHAIKKPEAEIEENEIEELEDENYEAEKDDSIESDINIENPEVSDKPEEVLESENEEKTQDPEAMLEMGYYNTATVKSNGADIFDVTEPEAKPVAHLDAGTELWIKTTEDEIWAEVYNENEDQPLHYIKWDDVIISQKPMTAETEEDEVIPARSVSIVSTLDDMYSVPYGTEITMKAVLLNFRETDICTYQWQYLDKETNTYVDIPGANESVYSYIFSKDNFFSTWKLVVIVLDDSNE